MDYVCYADGTWVVVSAWVGCLVVVADITDADGKRVVVCAGVVLLVVVADVSDADGGWIVVSARIADLVVWIVSIALSIREIKASISI